MLKNESQNILFNSFKVVTIGKSDSFLEYAYCQRVMLQKQTILQHFYKMWMWPTFYWFSSRPTINITFLFTNNHSPHQQFVKFFVKLFVSLALFIAKE